ncbi:jg20926 [Pararge aegeria aegeria]|uniref:poly(ADP-ribose) glycohydrolase n=1 Tax=Pararge aegeria aegeria TaxID=348720 RepID=A0A8S4RGD4_9NEOP|nr:jg20926 [Pararge aegeria aegeria]
MSVKTEQEFSTAMFGSQTVWLCPDFPAVEAADNHAVLYEIPGNGATWPYKPTVGDDKWDSDHVKMPCSDHNLYNIGDEAANVGKKWDLIVEALSKPMRNSQDILEAVLTYQPDFKGIWTFTALHTFFNEYWDVSESKKFFEETLPEVRKLALALPELIQSPIPMLKREQNKSVSFTQLQLASLLANAFFCTFPERNNKTRKSEYKTYPPANFNLLYDGGGSKVMEKLKCICHYFTRVCKEQQKGVVTFSRRHIPVVECPDWSNSSLSISKVPFFVDAETFIEDAQGCIQVDFASKYIGVGVLHRGAVQEEIRFVSNPELIVSMLFTEVMGPTETVMIKGINYPGVATGNWGCGASGGHARLKSLLQLMACVEASRPMCYYTFGDNELKGDILKVYSSLLDHNVTVGDLYKYLLEFCESEALIADFYGYLEEIMSKR